MERRRGGNLLVGLVIGLVLRARCASASPNIDASCTRKVSDVTNEIDTPARSAMSRKVRNSDAVRKIGLCSGISEGDTRARPQP